MLQNQTPLVKCPSINYVYSLFDQGVKNVKGMFTWFFIGLCLLRLKMVHQLRYWAKCEWFCSISLISNFKLFYKLLYEGWIEGGKYTVRDFHTSWGCRPNGVWNLKLGMCHLYERKYPIHLCFKNIENDKQLQWFQSLFMCRIATLNFWFNIVSSYMGCVTHQT